mmetsp:Transcript_34759/g.68609  ORF Transcript_34759/g.68609 Transcript_34759/m.68609 type:complete len:306 (-) Transcript_34759:30-947(-)
MFPDASDGAKGGRLGGARLKSQAGASAVGCSLRVRRRARASATSGSPIQEELRTVEPMWSTALCPVSSFCRCSARRRASKGSTSSVVATALSPTPRSHSGRAAAATSTTSVVFDSVLCRCLARRMASVGSNPIDMSAEDPTLLTSLSPVSTFVRCRSNRFASMGSSLVEVSAAEPTAATSLQPVSTLLCCFAKHAANRGSIRGGAHETEAGRAAEELVEGDTPTLSPVAPLPLWASTFSFCRAIWCASAGSMRRGFSAADVQFSTALSPDSSFCSCRASRDINLGSIVCNVVQWPQRVTHRSTKG